MNQALQVQDMTVDEIRKLFLKLRWLGLENDAQALQRVLRDVQHQFSMLTTPVDTD